MVCSRLITLTTIHGIDRDVFGLVQTVFLLLFGLSPSRPHPFVHSIALFAGVVDELLHVAFFQKFLNNRQLSQLLSFRVKLRLFLDDQIVPIFQGVLRPALKVADHFGPLLLALVPFDGTEEEQVLFLCPGAFLQVRVQIAIPMFPALLRAAINFVRVRVAEVQLLGNYAPVPFSIFPIIGAFLLDEFFQQLRLSFCPAVLSQIVLLQAQPLEHASFGLNSRDDGGDELPVLDGLHKKRSYEVLVDGTDALEVRVFGNSPDEDGDVLFAPVLLEFLILDHPVFKYPLLLDSAVGHLLNDLGAIVIVQLELAPLAMLKHIASKLVLFHLLHFLHECDQSRVSRKHLLNIVLGKDLPRLRLGSFLLTLQLGLAHHEFELRFAV